MTERAVWPVVAGVDGSDEAMAAVRWAADEAVRRGTSLRLVAAVPWETYRPIGVAGLGPDHGREVALRTARGDLEAASAEAGRVLPAGRIDGEVVGGKAADVLHGECVHAELAVLGTRGRGGFTGLLAGSVAIATAAHAECPVVVVRGESAPEGPVVVGVDGSPGGDAAVAAAFAEAARRGVALRAVHTWLDEFADPYSGVVVDRRVMQERGERLLDEALAGWADKYPEVPVHRRVTADRAASALVGESVSATLVVVGSRGHGVLVGMLLSSVGRALIQHSHCPVEIVHADEHPVREP